MANQLLYLQLNKEHPSRLSRPFATGSTIDFLSTSYDGIPDSSVKLDLANIDLINGNDVLLQISVRRVIDHILLDTSRNGVWDQKYQSIDLTGAFSGLGARIRITATEHSYQISFDDSSKVHTFKKRIKSDATAVAYRSTEGQRRVFSNPLIVEVFDPQRSGHPHKSAAHPDAETESTE